MKRPALFTIFLTLAASHLQAAMDTAQLQAALRKLTVLGSAMYVAAHPDDENTAMLAWLEEEQGVRAAYLSVTRGDGGQNLIGTEKGALLGVIRTQELLAARRVDGAEQFFTRAVDFGYSKTAEETLKIWDRETILGDVVWNIRRFQPDVIISRFPTTGEGGHGQHTASAILAAEAFAAAADAQRFPEQLRYVAPWQAKRLVWNRFSRTPIDPKDPAVARSIRIDIGTYNRLLGRAYTEIAAESRSQHKSQGFGSAERRGSIINYFDHVAGEPAQKDLFEGVTLSWSRYPGGEAVGTILQKAADSFDPRDPQKSIPLLLEAHEEMSRVGARPEWSPRANPWIDIKRRELLEVIKGLAGISIDVSAADSAVIPGGEVALNVAVVNRSDYPFFLSTIASPYASPGMAPGKRLENNVPIRTEIKLKVPADHPYSQPYWLQKPGTEGQYAVPDPQWNGLAENPPSLPILVSISDNLMHTLIFSTPAVYRWTDPVAGEQIRNVDVVPEVTANVGLSAYLFPDVKPRTITVSLRNFGGETKGTVRLQLPSGWTATPASAPLTFARKGDEAKVTFRVTPPASAQTGDVRAEVELASGKKVALALAEIAYEHIPATRVFSDASARIVRADVRKRGTRIGYVAGSGDDVPAALKQMGYEVELLSDEDLERGDFARYDAIVTGVRAYNTRKRLRVAQPQLLAWVAGGGTMVVQYNTSDEAALAEVGPYPFKISRDRVTVEEAPVRLVRPDHPLLSTPNKITDADFQNWVQERGLYFTSNWDPKYQTILASADPGEPEKEGGELYVRHGKGVFVYTSYAWFRQLPAGVAGAYRLFANRVSAQ
ncbi:MAG TPA: PIG-L family deacetylase [Thermoanaerobaculia bacterium]|nr:PIG-L family deacetylase [Thermoanaerobaculia bacterium]